MRNSRKDVDSRQLNILNLVREQGEVRSEDIAKRYSISMMTVRRDLQLLEERRLLKRTHGGAVSFEKGYSLDGISADVTRCRNKISEYAATLVETGNHIFINGSRTALNLLKYVRDKNVMVCTNNGWALGEEYPGGVNVKFTGGEARDMIMVGELTMRNLLELTVDKTFLGCASVYDDGKFQYNIPNEIGINEAMISRTRNELFILADHTKIKRQEHRDDSYGSCSYERALTLVTDEAADPIVIEKLRQYGMKIVLVPLD
ncbi:MAG: DeoR/GlpR transcriptional regulator [Lachnospiraceae bacterium]|nr:DeoR/GlpR transcriptional regulator [Lachnospiraceae bacterium]